MGIYKPTHKPNYVATLSDNQETLSLTGELPILDQDCQYIVTGNQYYVAEYPVNGVAVAIRADLSLDNGIYTLVFKRKEQELLLNVIKRYGINDPLGRFISYAVCPA